MKLLKRFMLLLIILLTPTLISAQELSGEELEVRLVIIGQGDPVYSLWGHTGLNIRNKSNGTSIFYDFGNFSFKNENFIKNFAFGRLLYIAYAQHYSPYINYQKLKLRNIDEYVLDLPPISKLKMYYALQEKTKLENRTYLYHHYNDNCSTRIRDYINDAVSGQLYEQTDRKRGSTFRKSFLLFTSNQKFVGSMLSLLQGPSIDKEITIWQEMFLPQVMGTVIRDFTYTDARGEEISLVKETNIVCQVNQRESLPEKYSPPYGAALLISALLFSLILFINFKSSHEKRKLFVTFNILFGFVLGILGSVLLFLAAFTDHSYSYHNINLFMINPLALFIIPAAIMYGKKGDPWRKKLDMIWLIQIISTIIMILIKAITPVKQFNHIEIIIVLPMLIAFSPILPALVKRKKLLR